MKQLALVSSVLVLAFGIVLGTVYLKADKPLALLSEAKDVVPPYCPIDLRIYVHEIDKDGQEVPLSIESNADIDVLSWSIVDGQNPVSQPLYFNQLPRVEYTHTSDSLTFTSLPLAEDIYQKGDITFLSLNYQSDLFNIVKQEIATCTSPNNPALCSTLSTTDDSLPTTSLDTINGIKLDCNMRLEAGWVVQRRPSGIDQSVQSAAPSTTECDLNDDGACNTFDLFIVLDSYGKEATDLPGDLNGDSRVNALDYTLMTSKISLL